MTLSITVFKSGDTYQFHPGDPEGKGVRWCEKHIGNRKEWSWKTAQKDGPRLIKMLRADGFHVILLETVGKKTSISNLAGR